MPAKILLQETFAEGSVRAPRMRSLSRGFIDGIREEMAPLYNFFDMIVQRRAWTPDFYKADPGGLPRSVRQDDIRRRVLSWANSYTAKWPSLLKGAAIRADQVDDVKLRAVIALMEVLMPNMDDENKIHPDPVGCEQFNELKLLFQSPLILDPDAMRSFLEEKGRTAQGGAEGRQRGGERDAKATQAIRR